MHHLLLALANHTPLAFDGAGETRKSGAPGAPDPMPSAAHYLDIAVGPERLRVGPLPAVVRVGADPTTCDIVLAARLGVPDVALVLNRDTGDAWRLDLPGASRHPCSVDTGRGPRPARPGDLLGPGDAVEVAGAGHDARLTLRGTPVDGLLPPLDEPEVAALPTTRSTMLAHAHGDPTPPRSTPTAAPLRLLAEVSRQVRARALAASPTVARLSDALRRYGGGRWRSPYVIIGLGAGVAVVAGSLLLSGLAIFLALR